MNKSLNEAPKYFWFGIFFALVLSFVLIFVFSKSYALEGFGQLNLSCDKTIGSGGENIHCIVTGTVASTSQVSSLSSQIRLSDNLEFVSFTTDSIWQGTGNDGNIQLYTAENKSSTFAIGSFSVKIKEGVSNTTETIELVDNYFYDELFEEQEVQDVNVEIKTPQYHSDVYDMTKDYIITNTKDIASILSSIMLEGCSSAVSVNGQDVTTGTIDTNSTLKIINGNDILGEFAIVYIHSKKYDLSKEYIIDSVMDINKVMDYVEVLNGTLSVKNEQLVLSYNNTGIFSYDILNLTSSIYSIHTDKDYILVSDEINDNILNYITTSSNVGLGIVQDQLQIYYHDKNVKSLSLINLSSNLYEVDLVDNYIYIGDGSISNDIIHNLSSNVDLSVEGNQLSVSNNGEKLVQLDIINIQSIKYRVDTDNQYIYTKNTNQLSEIRENLKVTNGDISIEGNYLKLGYKDKDISQFTLYYLTSSEYRIVDDNIYISGDVEYSNFVQSLSFNGLIYHIYNSENQEISSGTVSDNYQLKVYVGDILVDTYIIKTEFLEISDLPVKEEDKVIYHIGLSTTYSDIAKNISTSGTVEFYDKNGVKLENSIQVKSYSSLKVKLSSGIQQYQIAVLGDVTGSGNMNAGDIAKMYQIVKGKITADDISTLAGDVTFNGKIEINDVAKAYSYLKGKLTSLK